MSKRIAVVMAGGAGERFWPLSRPGRPKQLLNLTHPNETMLQEAVSRIAPVVGSANVVVSVGASIEGAVREADVVSADAVWAEPARRNTFGCLVWVAANLIANGDGDATVAMVTADHRIGEPDRFRSTVSLALDAAEKNQAIVTIGIVPDRAETGFGYIEADREHPVADRVLPSAGFREKPSLATAQQFVASGNFLWNAGMFFFPLPVMLAEIERVQPDARHAIDGIATALRNRDNSRAVQVFETIPSISLDYAVMEDARGVLVVPSDFPWDDLGSWDALERSLVPDALGNVIQGHVALIDTQRSIVVNDMETGGVGVLGLNDVVVVATNGNVLVCAKDQAQRVRELAAELP